jgi:hypothetical protein
MRAGHAGPVHAQNRGLRERHVERGLEQSLAVGNKWRTAPWFQALLVDGRVPV